MNFEINGLRWEVSNVDKDDPALKNSRGNACFGVTEYPTLKISMMKDLTKELYRQCLIHELVHAYTFSFGVHLFADEETEESVCDFVGAFLDSIYLRANEIMAYFYGRG